ncbi:MAG: hypothetical protein IPM60_14305 [Rhodospirillales bacterium]|nr:hypothetical protein [Rhodospirillales bacterium]
MRALTVGEVIASNNDGFAPGEFVAGIKGREYALSDGAGLMKAGHVTRAGAGVAQHPGIAGLTAYCGLIEAESAGPRWARPVVVTRRRRLGWLRCRTIARSGMLWSAFRAGGAEKCAYLTDVLGVDAAVDQAPTG